MFLEFGSLIHLELILVNSETSTLHKNQEWVLFPFDKFNAMWQGNRIINRKAFQAHWDIFTNPSTLNFSLK